MRQAALKNLQPSFTALCYAYVQSALLQPALRHMYSEEGFLDVLVLDAEVDSIQGLKRSLLALYQAWLITFL